LSGWNRFVEDFIDSARWARGKVAITTPRQRTVLLGILGGLGLP
jgi:hypothetical protein